MLIVCPSCATSYTINPTSVGELGRTVRCARCKTLWFVAPPRPNADETVAAFVDDVIAEAQGQPPQQAAAPPPTSTMPPVREEIVDGPISQPMAARDAQPAGDETDAFRAALGEPGTQPAADAMAANGDATEGLPAEHIGEAPSLVPPSEPLEGDAAAVAPPAIEDVEDFAARRSRRQKKRQEKKSKLPYLILTLIGINAALLTWRADIVRMVPAMASLYAAIGMPVNVRGLEFRDVKIGSEDDGMNVLVVEGTIVSTSRHAVEVPRLRFSLRNVAGREIYSWTAQAGRSVLGPGESLPFRSRLSSPPEDAHDVLVRFFNSRDISGAN
jgi:predicted Zn finger-like uncharacterized protein